MNQVSTILVFGKDGQVGRALQSRLSEIPQTIFLGRADCDLTSSVQIKNVLRKYKPQVILNASAYTAVDKAELEEENAIAINSTAVHLVAEYIKEVQNGKLIHFSTDYVFDGTKLSPYDEMDIPNPLGQYGKSKLLGEQAIQEQFKPTLNSSAQFYILRTSWVYGQGENFIKTMLRLASECEQLKVISDQFGVPSSADWLAEIAVKLISSDVTSGIYHAVPDGETTWHGLATYVIEQAKFYGAQLKVKPELILAIPATEYPSPTKRPYNSRLNNQKLKYALPTMQFPNWQDQVGFYIKNLNTVS
jgi:dTDP-4-dehydrorhamnose reductase